jgi:hypothetical protein
LLLIANRASVACLGLSNESLRIVPLAASILALALWACLALQVFQPYTAVFSTALLAISPMAVHWGRAVRHFNVDLLCALLILAVAFQYAASPGVRQFALLVATAAVCVLLSYSSVIFLPSIAVLLLFTPGEGRKRLVRIAVFGLVAGSVTLVTYVLFSGAGRDPEMLAYWAAYLPSGSLLSQAMFHWVALATLTKEYLLPVRWWTAPFGIPSVLVCLILVGGLAACWRMSFRRGPIQGATLILTAGPLAVTMGLASTGFYPFGSNRTNLFLLPCFCLILGCAADAVLAGLGRYPGLGRSRGAGPLAMATVGVLVFAIGWKDFRQPRPVPLEDGRSLVSSLRSKVAAGDVVYIHASAKFQSDLYFAMARWRPGNVVEGHTGWPCCNAKVDYRKANHDEAFLAADFDAALRTARGRRIWFVYSILPGVLQTAGHDEAATHRGILEARSCFVTEESRFGGLLLRSADCGGS